MLSPRRPVSKSFCGTAPSLNRLKDERYGYVKARKYSEPFIQNAQTAKWATRNAGLSSLRRTLSLPDCNAMTVLFKNSRKAANFGGVKRTRSVSFAPEVLLFNAVVENDVTELNGLMEKYDVDLNYRSPSGLSALHYGAIEGTFECVQFLVENGADIDVQDTQGCSPLDFAVRGGHFDCASYLIKAGAEITRIVNGMNY